MESLPWLPPALRIHVAGKAGPPYKPLQPRALPLPGRHTPGVASVSTHRCLFDMCCLHRTLDRSLASGSLWALHKPLLSDSQGPHVRAGKLERPAGRTSSASVVAWSPLELESPHW